MKILHTSDWHLGRSLHDKKRYEEYDSFLGWLIEFIIREKIDILLIAGDVFDSSVPGNRAQEQYYGFLAKVRETCCRHVIIIGGNHDSPTFLEAPKNILGFLHIKVIGAFSGDIGDEIYIARDSKDNPEAIICAVPFLRERDIRIVEPGESPEDKTRKIKEGIVKHYRSVYEQAHRLRENKKNVPVIGMGHLFTAHGRTQDGDGMRELYIGTIAHIDSDDISKGLDYMALGHLHMAQAAEGTEKIRYSGSPLPMGFSEAGQVKKVLTTEFSGTSPMIAEHEIPCFQEMERISGDLDEICARIKELKEKDSTSWLEIEVTTQTAPEEIRTRLDEMLEGTRMEILTTKKKNLSAHALDRAYENETLEAIGDRDVFRRCILVNNTPDDQQEELLRTYEEAVASMQADDTNAN